ncbi:MAG: serine/threonine protein kinase [Candidatus Wallbacteria bacterium]|nr:serine/threonine protein kinase [Candidatus Wallbacteria bacterium]
MRRIGAGGMGAVYEAVQNSLGRRVALKLMRHDSLSVPKVTERFRAEIAILSKLRHPNIVPLYDAGCFGNDLYLAMELVPGGTLHDKIRGARTLGLPASRALMEQLLEGLAYLHDNGVIHRDLKPENLLLEPGGTVKLADFGLALAIENPLRLTEAGRVVGTPAYMAPEQILKRPLGPSADIYAAGMLLFRVLTGTFPFEASDERDLLRRKIERDGCLEEHACLLPEAVRDIVVRCLKKEPEERYADARDLARAIFTASWLATSACARSSESWTESPPPM